MKMEKIIITRPLSKGEIIYSDLRTYIYGVAFLLCTLFFYMTWQSVDYNPTGWTTVLLITLCLLGVVFLWGIFFYAYLGRPACYEYGMEG